MDNWLISELINWAIGESANRPIGELMHTSQLIGEYYAREQSLLPEYPGK